MRRSLTLLLSTTCLARFALGQGAAFLSPPQHAGPPRADHALATRAFQGIPSLAAAPGGRLWATWYAGPTPGEDQNNYVVLATSEDDGLTWTEVLIVDPDGAGEVRAFDPEVWLGPDGRLRLFWAQTINHDLSVGGVWWMETATPDSAAPAWQAPRRLTDGVMMCKPLVLSTGEWGLPAATWYKDGSAKMVVSADAGTTWSVRGTCNVPVEVRNCDEHMLVERTDGSLWMLVRTQYGIGESVSTDRGVTWPELTPSAIAHPASRFFVSRLASGHLLLVKHGPIATRTNRSQLTAFVSQDDGVNWEGGLLLDERLGVSYPDGQQTADGRIRIIYDYHRTTDRQILMAAFQEEDVAAGTAISGAVQLRQLVSSFAPPAVSANRDGASLRQQTWGAWSAEGIDAVPFVRGARLFTDSAYTAHELPSALDDASPTRHRARFLRLPMRTAPPTLTCTRAGTVYVLTPAPERDGAASQSVGLITQGFAKVRLPEVRLLSPTATTSFCTVYQKDCAQGEQLTLNAWAIPFFFQ